MKQLTQCSEEVRCEEAGTYSQGISLTIKTVTITLFQSNKRFFNQLNPPLDCPLQKKKAFPYPTLSFPPQTTWKLSISSSGSFPITPCPFTWKLCFLTEPFLCHQFFGAGRQMLWGEAYNNTVKTCIPEPYGTL